MKKYIIGMVVALIMGVIIGFFVGQEYTKNRILKQLEKAFSPNSAETTLAESKQLAEELKQTINKSIGDEIELATIRVKVNSSQEESMIKSSYGQPKVAPEGTKFVVVNATITNITKIPFDYSDSSALVDDKDTTYFAYNETIGSIDNYLDMQEISPNIPKTGVIVFQLPTSVESYGFVIKKAGTEELFKVKLK
jgi:hypothetical protein